MQPKSKGRKLWRRMAGIGLGASFAVVAMVPTAAAASNPVHTTASSTYTAVPSQGMVNVSVTLKVTNNHANGVQTVACDKPVWDEWLGWTYEPSTCKQEIDYYTNQTLLFVENDASQLKVTAAGKPVKLAKESETWPDHKAYRLTFPKTFKGQTRTITATYVIKGAAARSSTTARINAAYVNFQGITQPVDSASVRIVVPSSLHSVSYGNKAKTTTKGSQTIHTASSVDNKATMIGVQGTNPSGFDETVVTSGSGRDIHVQAWPGDKAWSQAVATGAEASITNLEGLVGQPIPGSGPIVVREVAGGSLGEAYAGIYDQHTQTVSIPETYADAALVAHELSHTWFNGTMFDAQWLSEGYAGWAERAVGANTTSCGAPTSVNLSAWQIADFEPTQAQTQTVQDEYDAACNVVSDAANQVGADHMKDVFTVLSTDAGAYPGTQDAQPGAPNSWRQWLDAVDERGMVAAGKTDATPVADDLIKYGIATSAELTARSSARTDLAALRAEAGSSWTIPAAVYAPMETWDFSTAGTAMSDVKGTIADVEVVASDLPAVTVDSNPIQDRLASAATLADLTNVVDTASAQRATADEVAATIERTHSSNPFEVVGLIGTDVNAKSSAAVSSVASLDLDGAKAQVGDMQKTLDGATAVGMVRILAVLAAISLLSIGIWRRRRGGGMKIGSASGHDEPRTSLEPTAGLAAVSFDDQSTAI